jgi:hypothetical protein
MGCSPRVHPIACKSENGLESAFEGGVEGLYFFLYFLYFAENREGFADEFGRRT